MRSPAYHVKAVFGSRTFDQINWISKWRVHVEQPAHTCRENQTKKPCILDLIGQAIGTHMQAPDKRIHVEKNKQKMLNLALFARAIRTHIKSPDSVYMQRKTSVYMQRRTDNRCWAQNVPRDNRNLHVDGRQGRRVGHANPHVDGRQRRHVGNPNPHAESDGSNTQIRVEPAKTNMQTAATCI